MRPQTVTLPRAGQTSVWDFPRPPSLERELDRVTIELDGRLLADTDRAIRVCETASPPAYYVPREDFDTSALPPAIGASECEWKGRATYWSLLRGAEVIERAAWSYETPQPEYAPLARAIAVYPAAVDRCRVAGMAVQPQPGGFYGGWITPDLVGPFKGMAGSSRW